jgi:hypothetical protein
MPQSPICSHAAIVQSATLLKVEGDVVTSRIVTLT